MFLSFLQKLLWAFMVPPVAENPPVGYGQEDINFGRFYKAATQTSKRVLKEVFLIIFYRAHVISLEFPSNVREYCLGFLGWSNKKFRESFNATERELLEKPVVSTEFDISLLTKLIHGLFSDVKLPESFIRAVRELKNVRNRVCHEQVVLDNDALTSSMGDLKTLFINLLKETEEFFSVSVDKLQQTFNDEIDAITKTSMPDDASVYFAKVEEFKQDLEGKFIVLGRKELMALYSKMKTLNPFSWLSDEKFPQLSVDKIFAPLHIMDGLRLIDIEDILTTEPLSEATKTKTSVLPSMLILSGVAGCGKTSLCRYLLHEWRNNHGIIAGVKSIDIAILIEVRNLTGLTSSSFITYLQRSLLKDTCSNFDEKDIVPTLQRMNVLYVIDGLDEASATAKQLIEEVISVLGTSRVILTTRPEFITTAELMAFKYHQSFMSLQVYGFSRKSMQTFISQVFSSFEPDEERCLEQENDFLKFLSTTRRYLGDHLKIPLILVLLILLWRESRSALSKVTSVTQLYFEIFKMCMLKMLTRIQRSHSVHLMEMESFSKTWLLALGKEAYDMLHNDEIAITDDRQERLVALCSDLKVSSVEVLSAFLICDVQETLTGMKYTFSFIHKSQMEYLAGMFVSHTLTRSRPSKTNFDTVLEKFKSMKGNGSTTKMQVGVSEPVILKSMSDSKWTNTLMFTMGHLCMDKDVRNDILIKVMGMLLTCPSTVYSMDVLWHIVQESGCNSTVCSMVGNTASKDVAWNADADSLCDETNPYVQMILHTPFTPVAVKLSVIGSVHKVKVLGKKGVVQEKQYVNLLPLLKCFSQKPSVKVAVKCDQHFYEWGNPQTTDDMLQSLLPTGNLEAVMGHLGVPGAAALASVKQLGNSFIRISTVEALHALSSSIKTIKSINGIVLRLDLPSTEAPQTLPKFKGSSNLCLVLKDIDDSEAIWAAQIISLLSSSYISIDFVSSALTDVGGNVLLERLRKQKIAVSEKLTIRSSHKLEEQQYKKLINRINYKLAWWS